MRDWDAGGVDERRAFAIWGLGGGALGVMPKTTALGGRRGVVRRGGKALREGT
jgi:hypothetical protein